MIAFMQTLLPEPVDPATSICGIRARSAITGSPPLPSPSGTGNAAVFVNSFHSGASITDRRVTSVGWEFGTSIPTTDSPGTGASNLRLGEASARAMSFSRASIVSTRTRCPVLSSDRPFQPGLSPYIVTVGPWRT